MGLETFFASLPPKKQKLFQNIAAVGIIFTLLYGFWSLGYIYFATGTYMSFFNMQTLLPLILLLIVFYFLWQLSHGKKLKAPTNNPLQPQQQPQRQQAPRPPQRRPAQPKQQPRLSIPQQPQQRRVTGSITCPKCNTLILGQQCPKCGYRRA